MWLKYFERVVSVKNSVESNISLFGLKSKMVVGDAGSKEFLLRARWTVGTPPNETYGNVCECVEV